MYQPKVSIVTATWNRGDILDKAIKSVLWQTYQNWELVIVDDGSTDNTREVVESFADDRIKYINKGKQDYYTTVRNIGIKESDGELICFHDDDHIMMPTYLEELVKPHRVDDILMTYCSRKDFKGVDLKHIDLSKIDKIQPTVIPPFIYHTGKESLSGQIDVGDMMIKRSVFHGDFKGFRTNKDGSADIDNPGYCSDAKLIDDIERYNKGKFVLVKKRLSYYFLEHGSETDNMTTRKIKGREEGKMIDEKRWDWA